MPTSKLINCFYCNEKVENGKAFRLSAKGDESITADQLQYALLQLNIPIPVEYSDETHKVCPGCKTKLMSFSRAHQKMVSAKDALLTCRGCKRPYTPMQSPRKSPGISPQKKVQRRLDDSVAEVLPACLHQ